MPFDLMNAVAAAGQALGIIKDLREIDKEVDVAGYKARLAELTAALADMKMGLTDASTQLHEKDAEIERVIRDASKKAELVEVHGYSYEKNAQGQPEGWPFCPVCLEDEIRFYRLVKVQERVRGSCYCPKCKAEYIAAYIPPAANQRGTGG